MTDELKPCPFCGGETVETEPKNGSPFWKIRCKRCWASMGGTHRKMNRDDWNARHERTCYKVPGKMHYGERRPKCSECGYGLGDDRWAYCPKCGAKVVG